MFFCKRYKRYRFEVKAERQKMASAIFNLSVVFISSPSHLLE